MSKEIGPRVLVKYLSEFWDKLLVFQGKNGIGFRWPIFLFNFFGQKAMASFEGSIPIWHYSLVTE